MKFFASFSILIILQTALFAGIALTKHNLSSSTTNTVRAQSGASEAAGGGAGAEDTLCVFCHIPHSAQSASAPLWNRSLPDTSYTMYVSPFMKRIGYPEATSLSTVKDEPGARSRNCLSCHDGTVAVGAIYVAGGSKLTSTLGMVGVEANGSLPSSSAAFIGTDLTDHHPIGIEYDTGSAYAHTFADGNKTTAELRTTPTSPIRLYYSNGKQYVECSSCHDPHTSTTEKFLRVSTGANHAQRVVNTCTSCHDRTGWNTSIHQENTLAATYTDGNVTAKYGTNLVKDLGCINCHTPHNGEGVPSLLRKVEQNTCFQGAASDGSTTTCHGAGATKDIESLVDNLAKPYKHPVTTYDGVHTGLDVLYGSTEAPDPNGYAGITWPADKHAECYDCHNPHQARQGTHTETSNTVSNALLGVTGVQPTWPSRWTQPTTFTPLKEAQKEYQICMKCHSRWALGASPTNDGVTGKTFDSDSYTAFTVGETNTTYITDQSWEINPNNRAAHPIALTTQQMLDLSATSGSRYADALPSGALAAPWNDVAKVGQQTMYCSDCHGNETGGDPKGPHGSSMPFMLKGPKTHWPKDSGGNFFTMSDGQANDPEIFCLNCHVYTGVSVHQTSRMKMRSALCVNCHIAIPHGGPVSRLIGYNNMPAPYNFDGVSLQIDQYKWNTNNTRGDVYSTHGNCAGGSCHSSTVTGFDSYP